MTREVFNEKSFDEVMEQLNEEWDDIHTYEAMIDYTGYLLNKGNLNIIIHILEAMRDNPAEWYLYDFTMGTLEAPKAIACKEDLEDTIEERI